MKKSQGWVRATAVVVCVLGGALSAQSQMTTPGSFSVSDLGAAVYSVPIGLPAGTGGVSPQLALNYSSQAGNGLLGVGWNLSGLSVIMRCAATPTQDGAMGVVGYNMSDRYCLDGQRLIAISGVDGANGTEYRTEQDGLSKITSYGSAGTSPQGGPQYFTIKTKAGLTMQYGYTADSRIEAQGQAVVRTWALNSVSDTKGNYMNIVYTEDNANGQYQPSYIDYTGSSVTGQAPMNRVHFDYETRPDIVPQYKAGSMIKNTQRLTRVWTTTTQGSTTPEVGEVRVAYESATSPATARSRVSTVQACDGAGAAAKCLPAVKMTWSGSAIKSLTPITVNTTITPPNSADKFVVGDFNGDGRADTALIDTANNTLYIYRSQGGSGTVLSMQGTSNSLSAMGYNSTNQSGYTVMVADFNGDGLSDLLEVGTAGYYLLISKGDGTFTSDGLHTFANGFVWSTANCYLNNAMDLNMDGATDFLMACYQGSPASSQVVATYMNDGHGNFTAKPTQSIAVSKPLVLVDTNFDGFPDIFFNYIGSDYVLLSQKDGTFSSNASAPPFDVNSQTACGSPDFTLFGQYIDFNGDGIWDCGSFNSTTDTAVQFGHGVALMSSQFVYPEPPQPSASWAIFVFPMPDYIGYMLSDTLYLNDGRDGDEFFMDVNGDGLLDLVFFSATDPSRSANRSAGQFAIAVGHGDGSFDPQGAINYSPQYQGSGKLDKIPADLDGDGRQDLILYVPAGQAYIPGTNGQAVTASTGVMYAYMPQGDLPDLVTKVEQGVGLGTSVSVTYKPLPQMGTGYVKELTPVYPKVAVTPSLSVVSQVDMANPNAVTGSAGLHTVTYRYGTALSEIGTGRGFLGFNWTEHTDGPSGLISRTYFRQDWPYLGKVDRTAEYTSTGVWTGSAAGTPVLSNPGSYFKQQINTYACLDISNPALVTQAQQPACSVSAGKRYLVYATNVTTSGQDLDGSVLPGDITTQTLDGWANPLTVTTKTTDGTFSKTTTNSYANDTTNWFLGRLLNSTVTAVSP